MRISNKFSNSARHPRPQSISTFASLKIEGNIPGSRAQGMSQAPKFLKSFLIFVISLMSYSLVKANGLDLKRSHCEHDLYFLNVPKLL